MAPLLVTWLLVLLNSMAMLTWAQQSCGGSCQTPDDCAGQLSCINGRCNDDPDVGTHICSSSGGDDSGSGGSSSGTCSATSGNPDSCCSSNTCQTISCSPPVSARGTFAILTLNDFSKGGDGGGPPKCYETYYNNSEKVVALSTGWYNHRCGHLIRINGNGKSTTAKVVDECDSLHGCDSEEHANQPPCANNIVDASDAVWQALGVSTSDDLYGYMHVTWQDA